jgi:6-methylsalicylate decarboxylase
MKHEGNDNRSSRRAILQSLAALGAGSMLPVGSLLAQASRSAPVTKKGRIDVHHHHRPAALGAGGGGRGPQWTPERSLEAMEKFNIATAIVSLTQMADRLYDGTEKGRAFARAVNDYGAKMTRDYPGKFGLIASVPMPDPEGALKEIEYSYDTLKTDGISMYTSIGRRYLGDPLFVPIFDELNRRKAVIFVHPVPPLCCEGLVEGMSGFAYELDFDTTRTAVSLVSSGTLARCPDLTFIFAHSGGTLPVLAGRINDRYPADKKYGQYACMSCRSTISRSRMRRSRCRWRRC